MARAAVKAKQAQKKAVQPPARRPGKRRHSGGGNPNQQLFFMRLRRRAKPMYVLLALLFGITFAFIGVGTGSNSGLDQLFSGLNIFGSSGTSVSKAQKEVKAHPNAAKGYRDLATAYEAKSDDPDAISALQQYTNIKPKDAAAWNELGGLQLSEGQNFLTQYQDASTAAQLAAPSTPFLPTGKLATALGTNQIEQAASADADTSVQALSSKTQLAYTAAVASYQKAANLQPKQAGPWLQLGQTAQQSGDTKTALKAYKKYLTLNPDPAIATQVRALIKQLSPKPSG